MIRRISLLFILCLVGTTLTAQSPDLIFHSGFEPGTTTNDENSSDVDLIGTDISMPDHNDWEADLEEHPNIGYFKIQYQGGTPQMRKAEIADDPMDPANKVLQYWIAEPNISGAGRVQANLYQNNNLKEVFFKTRLYLPHDFNIVKNAPFRTRWLTLMEFWNNAFWNGEGHAFRIGVSLYKLENPVDSLHISIHSQTRNLVTDDWDNEVWEYINTDYAVPIGKWLTIAINFVEGGCDGRFFMSITPDGEPTTIVHDITDYTHHPADPNPDGLTDFNPLKLYTSEDLVNYITDEGGLLHVCWDDFEIWKDSVVVATAPCHPVARGPYLQAPAPTGMTIRWDTREATDSKVWYGPNPGNLNNTVTLPTNTTEHEIQITGLSANTTYYYAIGDSNGVMAGEDPDHHFKTSPTTGSQQTIRAWILGDPGMRNDEQRTVRDGYYDYIGTNPTDLLFLLGDNAFAQGLQLEYQMALFEHMYEGLLKNTPLWATLGEEETPVSHSISQTGPFYDIFSFPTDGSSGGTASGTKAWYSFDYGNVHFVVLNSVDVNRSPGGAMMSWLQNDLDNTDQEWIVALFHHPPYSGSFNNISDIEINSKDMREIALPILEAAGVDVVLGGSSHNYQRSWLLNGHYGAAATFNPDIMVVDEGNGQLTGDDAYLKAIGGPTDGLGAVYVVAGSAGRADHSAGDHPTMLHRTQKLGSVALEISGLQMDLRFIDEHGEVEDHFTILKQFEPPIVNISTPLNDQYYLSPQPITILADATDSNGSINSVALYANNQLVGTDAVAPYNFDWTIPADGLYILRVEATDNDGNTGRDIIRIGAGDLTTCQAVDKGSDDVEEKADGDMSLLSGDLEMATDGTNQIVGVRFIGLDIPPGSTINNAYIQFTADDIQNINPCHLTIFGEDSDNAVTFLNNDFDLSNRPKTAASVNWSPPNWTTKGDAGPAQQTPDLGSIVQEIVNRPGYTAASALVFSVEGTGRRSADSFNGSAGEEPVLCVEYTPPPALPVELLSFTGRIMEDEKILLEWITVSEENNRHFVVERSADGQHFDALGVIAGNGTTDVQQQYQLVDQHPLPVGYYRLMQVDYDGTFAYSNVVVVELGADPGLRLRAYPSVAEENVRLRFSPFRTTGLLLKVVNSVGLEMYEERINAPLEVNFRTIDLFGYEPGIYHVSLTDGYDFATAKFVVMSKK